VPVYHRGDLGAGQIIKGPAIIEQSDCTIVVIPKWSTKVDSIGNLLITANSMKAKKKK
jgi:N-methylhydantoinase A